MTPTPIRLKCPQCGAVARGNDSHLGRGLKCPRCKELVRFVVVTDQPPRALPELEDKPIKSSKRSRDNKPAIILLMSIFLFCAMFYFIFDLVNANRKPVQIAKEQNTTEIRNTTEREVEPDPQPQLILESWSSITENKTTTRVRGRVTNNTNKYLEHVKAVAFFYANDQTLIKIAKADLEWDPLPPGETSPFVITEYNYDTNRDKIVFTHVSFQDRWGKDVRTLSREALEPNKPRLGKPDLILENWNFTVDRDGLTAKVTGQVTNNTNRDLYLSTGVKFRSENEAHVDNVRAFETPYPLPPGKTTSFTISIKSRNKRKIALAYVSFQNSVYEDLSAVDRKRLGQDEPKKMFRFRAHR